MISETVANYIIDIGLHMLWLYLALFLFFYLYAKKLQESADNGLVEDELAGDNLNNALNTVNLLNKQISADHKGYIDWNNVNSWAQKLIDNSQGNTQWITNKNKKVMILNIVVMVVWFIVLVGLYLYFSYGLGININLKRIITENVASMVIMGIIEGTFLVTIVPKYIPTTPSFVAGSALDRVKSNLHDKIQNN